MPAHSSRSTPRRVRPLANFVLAQQPDPLPVLRAQIEEGLPGETGMQLLELLDAVSAEAVEASHS